MAASENKKKKCQTVIPADWPKLTGPAYDDKMSVSEASSAWHKFKREMERVSPTPRVYRNI